MSRLHNVFCTAVFLLAIAMQCFAGGPEPAARIDLQFLGLKASNKDFYTDVRVHWWRQYIVVDSTYIACGKCRPNSTRTETPGPRLVIDYTTGKQVPPEAIADAVLEPNPQDFHFDGQPVQDPDGEVLAEWRGMTLVRGKENKLWLKEPGRPNTLLFSRPGYQSAVFISPELILIVGQIADDPNCTICHFHQWVIDKTGALKYKLPSFYADITDYHALSREGSRFAIRDDVESKKYVLIDILSLGTGSYSPINVARVRVFVTDNGKQMLEYKWSPGKYDLGSRRGIALSDDGALLAVVKGTDLLIFRIP